MTSYQERRICLTPDAVNSLSFNGHRVMIERDRRKLLFGQKNIVKQAEITNDTAKVFSCPMILKVGPPPC
jgi:alanine dehydrogenase